MLGHHIFICFLYNLFDFLYWDIIISSIPFPWALQKLGRLHKNLKASAVQLQSLCMVIPGPWALRTTFYQAMVLQVCIFLPFVFLNRTMHVMILDRITRIMGHAFFLCVVPNHGSHFVHAIGPQDSQTSKRTVTLNQHPPVNHEGWMVSG